MRPARWARRSFGRTAQCSQPARHAPSRVPAPIRMLVRSTSPVGHTAIYNPADPESPWTAGPDFPEQRGRGRYFCQPAAKRECPCATQPAGSHRRCGRIACALATRASAAARSIPLPPLREAPQQTCPPTEVYNAYEFDGTKLIPEPSAAFCGEPNMLLLPTGEVMLDGQVNYKSTGTFQNCVEADDHDVHPEPL